MIYYDLHNHSTFSADACDSVDAMCGAAVKKGITHLCITEHYDAEPNDTHRHFYNHADFSQAIDAARVKYKNKLQLLKGVEYGQPYSTPEEFDSVNKMDFDMIIGSVHRIGESFPSDPAHLEDEETSYELYFENILMAIQHGGFDVLGHMDFPSRYLNNYYKMSPILEQVITTLCNTTIIPEINTSPLRRGYSFTMPDVLILERYADNGGKYISTGSDAHRAEDVAADFDYLEKLIKRFNFTPVYFKDRNMNGF